jgi:hypothetical protein
MKRPQPRRPTSRLSTSSASLHSFKIDAGASIRCAGGRSYLLRGPQKIVAGSGR